MNRNSLPSSWMEISMEKANVEAASQNGQPNVAKAMKRKHEHYVSTDEEDEQPLSLRKARASTVTKPAARRASSLEAGAAATEAGVVGFVSGERRRLSNNRPVLKLKINMETEGSIASQAQRQMRQAASTVSELCTGFETLKVKNEELRKQVIDLEGQIKKWKGKKARWDEMKKELQRERDEVRKEVHKAVSQRRNLEEQLEKAVKKEEDAKVSAKKAIVEAALKAVCEKRDLEEKLERAVKQAEDVKAAAKKAIEEAALKAVCEKRDLEEKLDKAVKQAEDVKAAAKKAIYEAVASTKKCYKIGLGNFVAYLATGEGRSLGDYVNELVKEIPHDNRAPADGAVDMAGHKVDRAIKDEAP